MTASQQTTEQKIKVEVKDREWLEFNFQIEQGRIKSAKVLAQGCLPLIHAAQKAAQSFEGQNVSDLKWAQTDEHWDQMILEAISRLQGCYELPYKEAELCHCRKVPTAVVNDAILLGAHTPEKVKAWTGASGGCGTCRSDVTNMIEFRTLKKCQNG